MKAIELFAGIGGISLAMEWAGIKTIAFCEREPFCQKVLKKHWPDVPVFDDVRTLNRKVLEETGVIEPHGTVDIISGGFPCQPYSIAGERRGEEDDRALWKEMFRIIQEIRPRWVVGENVANFANMGLDNALSDLESIGYTAGAIILPALAVKAPHRRDRVFIVANLPNTNRVGYERIKRLSKNFEEVGKRGTGAFRTASKLFDDIDWKKRATESGFLGTNDGVPNRMDRIRALGNAVVPQQIYPIFKAIVEIEKLLMEE